ncbi:MAG: septum formation initiator family protein [Candidatus Eisenbacteria sp.]|nr:septum formation initiator family protein [Candidatus Eisenbacteria bacterium]
MARERPESGFWRPPHESRGGSEDRAPGGRRISGGEALFLRKLWHSTRNRWRRFAILALGLWALYALILSPHGWLQLTSLRSEVRTLRGELSELRNRKAALDHALGELDRREDFLLQKRAREEFGFARENERIYLLPADAEDERCLQRAEIAGADRFSDRRDAPAEGAASD